MHVFGFQGPDKPDTSSCHQESAFFTVFEAGFAEILGAANALQ
jgi:hypothetical protein